MKRYNPPVAEFSLKSIAFSTTGKVSSKSPGPSVILVIGGAGEVSDGSSSLPLHEGSSVIVAAGNEISISSSKSLELYIAQVGY